MSNSEALEQQDKQRIIELEKENDALRAEIEELRLANDVLSRDYAKASYDAELYRKMSDTILQALPPEGLKPNTGCNSCSFGGFIGYVIKRSLEGASPEELAIELMRGKPFRLSQPMVYALLADDEYLEKEKRNALSRNARIEACKTFTKSRK